MHTIERLDAPAAQQAINDLAAILEDAIKGGASVGFILPLRDGELEHYWHGIIAGVQQESRVLLVARMGEHIVGTVQVALESRSNGAHRAEVQKLLVHSSARRQGLGSALMRAAEEAARVAGRRLLILDTRSASDAERLYHALGYTRVGVIPGHARDPDGPLADTTIFYRWLEGDE